jgi:hypothetical protein
VNHLQKLLGTCFFYLRLFIMVRKICFYLAPLALFAMIAALHGYQVRAQVQRSQTCGRYTVSQMLARTEPLYRIVTARYGALSWSADAFSDYMAGETVHSLWSIVLNAAGSEEEVWFLWDAETGNLLSVSHITLRSPSSRKRPLLSRTQVVAIGLRWMHALGLADATQAGKPVWTLHTGHSVCFVALHVGDRTPWIAEDARTGELIMAQNWPRIGRIPVKVQPEQRRGLALAAD